MAHDGDAEFEADLEVGPRAIGAYSRLSYTMWYALAEFIDNSTQSRLNHGGIIGDVLKGEDTPLVVEITHDKLTRVIKIRDNSIGMSREDLVAALRVAYPTADSVGRSKYGMGMKTAACWIGKKWKVVTAEWASGIEWTAEVDVAAVAAGAKIAVRSRAVPTDSHYTEVVIWDLNRGIQKRAEANVREYLGSMYRFDLLEGSLKLLFNGDEITAPDEREFDTDEHSVPYKRDLPAKVINGHTVRGWVGVLRAGSGGRKYGGFSIFLHRRMIEGFPKPWRPTEIYSPRGADDEGSNNLLSQRLVGVIELDGFEVSHTKDAILFGDDEEEELVAFLLAETKDFRDYATRRRGGGSKPWTRDKVKELIDGMKKEFTTDEIKDAAVDMLPPLETILANNERQITALKPEEEAATIQVLPDLRVIVSLQERSENDPYLNITVGAAPGTLHVVINNLHPYYGGIESPDAKEECLRQYIYDAIAEYRVSKQQGLVNQNSVRRKKDDLLKAKVLRSENAAAVGQNGEFETIVRGGNE